MYEAEIVSCETIRSVNGWEIDRVVEFPINDRGHRVGKNQTWYDCVFNDTIMNSYRHLKDAIRFCTTEKEVLA